MSIQGPGLTTEPPCTEAPEDHRLFRRDEFWRALPGYADVPAETFDSHLFQMRNSVTSVGKLMAVLGDRVRPGFFRDLTEGLSHAPMSVRLSPFIVSLIDWDNPTDDPIRKQFLPLGPSILPDHPELHLDSLHEQADAAVPGADPPVSRSRAVSDAGHVPGLLPVLYAELRRGSRHG